MQRTNLALGLTVSSFVFLMLASMPLGFDQHHSGLILSSVQEFGIAMDRGEAYPFNQYGPAWILIFHFLSVGLPTQTTFLTLKFIGMIFVITTLAITYTLARNFLNASWSLFSVLLMCITYPFFDGFLPWPSLVVMPVIPYVTHVLVRLQTNSHLLTAATALEIGIIGILTGITLFTRAQIGVLLMVAVFLFLVLAQKKNKRILLLLFAGGLLISLSSVSILLAAKGWLESAIYDSFVMGLMYVLGDKSTFPFPSRTIILCFCILVALIYFQKKSTNKRIPGQKEFPKNKLMIACFVAIGLVALIGWIDRIFHRLWISTLLAVLILSLSSLMDRPSKMAQSLMRPETTLVMFSAVAFVQIWPLFDQMHAWWGISPLVVLVVVRFRYFWGRCLPISGLSARFIFASAAITFMLLTSLRIALSYSESRQFEIPGLKGNYASEQIVSEVSTIDAFFHENIPDEAEVLNLCPDGNLFFSDRRYQSSARNIVFWSTMKDNSNLMDDINDSSPGYLVVCNYTPFSTQLYDFFALQRKVIRDTLPDRIIVNELSITPSKKITIYAPANQD
jgi:hypothetical protein